MCGIQSEKGSRWAGSAGNGACLQVSWPDFSAQNPQGGMKADSYKLSSDLHSYTWHPPNHMQTQINKWFIF